MRNKKKLSILRLVLNINESSAPYNQLTLPMVDKQNVTICSFYKSEIKNLNKIVLLEGNGTIKSYFSVLKFLIKDKKFDIIHAHTPHVGFIFIILSFLVNKKLLSKSLFTVHNSYENFRLRNRIALFFNFIFFRKIVFCGISCYKSFSKLYKWTIKRKFSIIQNGVNLKRINRILNKGRKKEDDVFKIITVGRLIKIKNPFTLIEVFNKLNLCKSKLIIIGDGELKTYLIDINKEQKNIVFTGQVNRDSVFKYLKNADLFISTSRGEGLPIAALEAMACNCPVILSDIPPHREIVAGVDFITLVNPNDVDGYSKEILKVSKMLPYRRKELGEKCRKLVERYFSLNIMLRKYEELYDEVLDS